MITERRACKRYKWEALAFYNVLDEQDTVHDEGMAKIVDLSARGLRLELPKEPIAGQQMQLTLSLEGNMMTVRGTTMWADPAMEPYSAGLQIGESSDNYGHWVRGLER